MKIPSCVKWHVIAAVVLVLVSITTVYGVLATIPLVFVLSNLLGHVCHLNFTSESNTSTSHQLDETAWEHQTQQEETETKQLSTTESAVPSARLSPCEYHLQDHRNRIISVSSDISDVSNSEDPHCDVKLTPREQALKNDCSLEKLYGADYKYVFGGVDCTYSIPSKVDDALTRVLDVTFDKVLQHAKHINGDCVDVEMEVKHLTRLFLLRLLRRVTENCESLIEQTAKDIVSCVLEHFHFCYPWLKCTSHQKSTQQTIYNQSESIRRLFSSKRLHPAMIDRSAEVEYLKHMFSVLCKFDFPEQVKCSPLAKSLMAECFALQVMQLSDLISDPDRMNLLIAKILSGAKKMIAGSASPSVPFLYRYFHNSFDLPESSQEKQKITADFIMKDGLLFSLFMKFLYRQDAMHYIQFLGDLRELKLARHFASKKSFLNIEEKFFQCANKFDRILLSQECIEEWLTVLRAFDIIPWVRKEEMIEKIEKEIHHTLNNCYVERFRKSHDYIKGKYVDDNGAMALKCNAELSGSCNLRDSKHTSSESSDTPNSRLSSLNLTDESTGMSMSHSEKTEPCPSPVNDSETNSPNKFEVDMSSFRIEIEPDLYDLSADGKERNVVPLMASSGGSNFWYKIEVRRIAPNFTAESSHKSVFRKFEHFVVLHTKLRYHYAKELRDIKQPSKPAIILGNSCDYYRKMVPSMEHYLKCLLAKPRLRHSGTFYNFLTKNSSEDFEEKTILEKLVHTKNGITGNITNIANKESGKALEVEFLPKFTLSSGQGKPRLKVKTFGSVEPPNDLNSRKQSMSKMGHSLSMNGISSINGSIASSAAMATKSTTHINPSLQNNAFLDIIHLTGQLNSFRKSGRKRSSVSTALNEKQTASMTQTTTNNNNPNSSTMLLRPRGKLEKSASCDPAFNTHSKTPANNNYNSNNYHSSSSNNHSSSCDNVSTNSSLLTPVFAFCYDCCISSKFVDKQQPSSMLHNSYITTSSSVTHYHHQHQHHPLDGTASNISCPSDVCSTTHSSNESRLVQKPSASFLHHQAKLLPSPLGSEFNPGNNPTDTSACVDFSLNFQSYFDYLIYFCVYIYNTSTIFQKLVCGPLKIVTANFVDRFCSRFVRRQIVENLHEDQIEYFLNFVHSNLAAPSHPGGSSNLKCRSFQDKSRRRNRTLTLMRNFFNYKLISIFIGREKHYETTEILFKILQYSKLNKHLFYQILDKIISRLYEE